MRVEVFFCFLRLIKLVDVWEELIIATQPDMYVGRRKSVLSVCKLDFKSTSLLKRLIWTSAPLRIFGEKLELPVHTIPEKKSEFKSWEVYDATV